MARSGGRLNVCFLESHGHDKPRAGFPVWEEKATCIFPRIGTPKRLNILRRVGAGSPLRRADAETKETTVANEWPREAVVFTDE